MNKKVDYFNGNDWSKIEVEDIKEWFNDNINWDMVEDVMKEKEYMKVTYKDGDEVYYKNQFGKYSFPVRFR